MKVDVYVMGVYRGQREVGENSLVGKLVRGLYGEAAAKAGEMQAGIDAILESDGKTVNESEPADD